MMSVSSREEDLTGNGQSRFDASDLTDRILRQGKALVRAIEALGTIDPSGPIERAAARVLLCVHKRRSGER